MADVSDVTKQRVSMVTLLNWLDEPVRYTVIAAVKGAIGGAATHVLCNALLPVSSLHPECQQFLRIPVLEQARNAGVSMGAMVGVARVWMKLRGKDFVDFETSMVAGFSSGVAFSLAIGYPEAIPFGAFTAFMTGGMFKMHERFPESKWLKGKSVAFTERYHFTPAQCSSPSRVLPKETRNRQAFLADDGEFVATLKRLQSWLAKPVKETVTGAIDGALFAVCFRTFFPAPSYLDAKVFSSWGGYQPLIQSFTVGSRLELGRNLAVFFGVSGAITSVMDKLAVKQNDDDTQTCMVGGLGSGTAVSLVTGVRWPEAISVGVIYALANGGLCMAITSSMKALRKKLSEVEDHDDKTKDKSSLAGIDATNINTGLFTPNALSLQLDDGHRNEVKKGGKRTWF